MNEETWIPTHLLRAGQQMLQLLITFNSLQLVLDNLLDFRLDAVIVFLYFFFHVVLSFRIHTVCDDRDRFVFLCLFRYSRTINDNLRMKNLLIDTLIKVIRYRTCTLSNKSAQLQIELLKIVIYYYVFINYIFY